VCILHASYEKYAERKCEALYKPGAGRLELIDIRNSVMKDFVGLHLPKLRASREA
jgi:hypothetical protein